jgi:hypothetical protein
LNEVERRGLPTELALLPFIESAFNPPTPSHGRSGEGRIRPSRNALTSEQNGNCNASKARWSEQSAGQEATCRVASNQLFSEHRCAAGRSWYPQWYPHPTDDQPPRVTDAR